MRRLLVPAVLLLAAACATSTGGGAALPDRGAISIQVVPSPIVARHVSGETYDFPFEVVVRETAGRSVEIQRVTADVFALGLNVATETYDASEIRRLGYSTTLAANDEMRIRLSPRQEVPDERLFGSISAELRVEGTNGERGAVRVNVKR